MDKEKLNDILEKHKKWLNDEEGGERADLINADLSGANLSGLDLSSADLRNANLRNANLRYSDLSGADLYNAYLYNADLSYVYLRNADLSYVDLSGVDLYNADLYNADLRYANLNNANLRYASLRYANLRFADLRYANLRYVNLIGADLSGANLNYVKFNSTTTFYYSQCPEKGSFTAFKQLEDDLIAELTIPAKAKRSSATTRKCRASEVKVVKIWNYKTNEVFKSGVSQHDSNFIYEVGKTVKPTEKFNEDRWNECASGIHFFITLQEAIDY